MAKNKKQAPNEFEAPECETLNEATSVDGISQEVEETEAQKTDERDVQFDALNAQFVELQNQELRLRAEYDNFRKRTQAEKAATYNNAVSDTILSLLPVIDNLDRAMQQDTAELADYKKGIEMVIAQLNGILEEMGIHAIGEVGENFDPDRHNAVSHIEDDQLGENVVAMVLQKGYILGDKVVRHAMVQVAN